MDYSDDGVNVNKNNTVSGYDDTNTNKKTNDTYDVINIIKKNNDSDDDDKILKIKQISQMIMLQLLLKNLRLRR